MAVTADLTSKRNRPLDYTFWNKCFYNFFFASQFLAGLLIFPLFKTFLIFEINGRDNLSKVTKPFIIVANHFSFYDSFLLRIILGFKTRHLPLRIMAVKKFKWSFLNLLASLGVINFVYGVFGVFTVEPGIGIQNNLKKAKKILMNGETVVIYPEGTINIDGILGDFKKGAVTLARESARPILPITFKLGEYKSLRRVIKINIGAPYYVFSYHAPEEANTLLRTNMLELLNRN
jgi:1-acyl-sn-glycerol-3-phosphate acyltransferase